MVEVLLNELTELRVLDSVSLPFLRVGLYVFLYLDELYLWTPLNHQDGGPEGSDGSGS